MVPDRGGETGGENGRDAFMTMTPDQAVAAGKIGAALAALTASLAVLDAAMAGGACISSVKAEYPDGRTVELVLTPLDPTGSAALMTAATGIVGNLITQLEGLNSDAKCNAPAL